MEVCIECPHCKEISPAKVWEEIAGGIDPVLQAREKTMASLECPKCQKVVKGHQLTVCERDKELLGRVTNWTGSIVIIDPCWLEFGVPNLARKAHDLKFDANQGGMLFLDSEEGDSAVGFSCDQDQVCEVWAHYESFPGRGRVISKIEILFSKQKEE